MPNLYVINQSNIKDVYTYLGAWMQYIDYKKGSLVIKIENTEVASLMLDQKIINNIQGIKKQYIEIFNNKEKLDQRWIEKNDTWYLSYNRRLIRSRHGISQFNKAANDMLTSKNTRRCILLANDYMDNNNYCPALVYVKFSIEEDRLNMYVHWRSQELLFALPFNILAMISLQRKMCEKLNQSLRIEIGDYTQFVDEITFYKQPDNRGWGFWKYLDEVSDKDCEFLWSIVYHNKEDEYDKNY